MRTPQPIVDELRAEEYRQPHVGVVKALRAHAVSRGRAVPAARGFRHPERAAFHRAHQIVPERRLAEITHVVVMIELHYVHVAHKPVVVEAEYGHAVVPHGRVGVLGDYLALTPYKVELSVVLEFYPPEIIRRVSPHVRRGLSEIVERAVTQREHALAPLAVERGDVAVVLFFHVLAETLFALVAGTAHCAEVSALGLDFVVYLPADNVVVASELLCHFLDYAVAVFKINFAALADVAPAADCLARAVDCHGKNFGVLVCQPLRRTSRGRAHND